MLRRNFPGVINARRSIALDTLKRHLAGKIMSKEFIKRSNMDVDKTKAYFAKMTKEISILEERIKVKGY